MASLKALSFLLISGPTGSLLSLLGGFISVTVMLLFTWSKKGGLSYLIISILGAIAHNMGQLLGSSLLMGTTLTLYYFPILILSGIGMGIVTGLVLKTLLPAVEKLDRQLR